MKWNDLGTSLIVLAQTEVDKTGKSYYGETNLYILSANGGFDSRIQLGEILHSFLYGFYSLLNDWISHRQGGPHT